MDHAGACARDEGSPPAPLTSVSVIIPALNEEDAIGRVLGDLPPGVAGEVIVVDGGSSDRTPEIARSLGARVLVEERRGYGRACLAGLATADNPDVVVFLDGDYSDRPAELPALLAPIAAGEADLVIGSRLAGPRAPGAMGWHSVLGNRVVCLALRLLCGVRLTDLGPFRAARCAPLVALDLQDVGYGWPVEMILKARSAGLRVCEVPVSYHPRIGRSKITGTLRGTALAVLHMLRCLWKLRGLPAPRGRGGKDG